MLFLYKVQDSIRKYNCSTQRYDQDLNQTLHSQTLQQKEKESRMSKNTAKSRNPYNGEVREEFQYISEEELQKKIKNAEKGFQIQQKRTLQERAKIIAELGKVFQKYKKQLAEMMTFQMGKPITESQGEVDKAVGFCEFYSTHIQPLKPKRVETDAKIKTQVHYKPMGIVYLIVPFNVPLMLTFKGGISNLLVGNCLLVKSSSTCPALGRLIEKCVRQAGFDNGEFQQIVASHEAMEQIFKHKSVAGVSFTGSTAAGAKISAKAGQYLKKSVMQLGGNDPFVVLKDADLDLAVKKAIQGRTKNCGQICFSPKRFIIQQDLYDDFKKKLIAGLKQIKYGDPMNRETQLGPLAKQRLHEQLSESLKKLPKGYKVTWQREGIEKPFFPITVIEAANEQFDEELFGPVFILYKAKDQQEAIEVANQGNYGLGGQVFSKNRGQQVIDKIRCGMGFVNEVVKSSYQFPSGGVGKSGYGRECGDQGYKQFANIKVHYIC